MQDLSEMTEFYSLACHAERSTIYLTGGWNLSDGSLKSVFAFDVARNTWRKAPCMNEARENHSSLVLAQKLYVICGRGIKKHLNSIEMLDLRHPLPFPAPNKTWLAFTMEILTPRNNPLVC